MKNQPRPKPSLQEYFQNTSREHRLHYFKQMAALAPSPYNTQPWHLTTEGDLLVIAPHKSRLLKEADPKFRGLYFSLGAAMENVVLAANALGVKTNADIASSGDAINIRIAFEGLTGEPSAIDFATLEAIQLRHTNRFAFYPQKLPSELLAYIRSQSSHAVVSTLTDNPEKVLLLQHYTLEAVKQIFSDTAFRNELSHWVKPNHKKHETGMPGYVLGISTGLSYILPHLMRHGSSNFVTRIQQKVHARWFDSAQTIGYIGITSETPAVLIEGGRVFERIAVMAQKYGIALGPMSALIEGKGFAQKIGEVFESPTVPAMIYRIGFPTKRPPASPRFKNY